MYIRDRFWKRSNKYGALAGMIAGGVMVFVWKYLVAPLGGAFGIYELLPAFVFGALVNIIVSLATPAPEKEIVEEFELVQKMCIRDRSSGVSAPWIISGRNMPNMTFWNGWIWKWMTFCI